MLTDFGKILIFFIIGVLFTGIGLMAAWLIRPRRPYPAKNSIYECGEDTIGSSWVKFNIRFYVVALIFVIFEVETVVRDTLLHTGCLLHAFLFANRLLEVGTVALWV